VDVVLYFGLIQDQADDFIFVLFNQGNNQLVRVGLKVFFAALADCEPHELVVLG